MFLIEKELAELLDYRALENCPDENELKKLLAKYIDALLVRDFPRLCQLLYRVDVDEDALRRALTDAGGLNPAEIIADLLLERQKQKLALRNRFSASMEDPKTDIADSDRW